MEGSGIPSTYWAALMRFAQQVGAEDPVNQIPSQVRMMSEEVRNLVNYLYLFNISCGLFFRIGLG